MTYRHKESKTEKHKHKTSFPFTGPDGKVHIAKRARFEENGILYEIFHAEDEYEVWLVTDPATHPFAYLLKMGINCDEERSRPMTHEEMQHLQVSYACAVVAQQVESFGMEPVTVPITYYKDQAMYDEYGRDEGPFGQANANARAVATALEQRGIKVTFNYPLHGAIRTDGSRY